MSRPPSTSGDRSAPMHRPWLVAFLAYLVVLGAIFAGAYLGLVPTRLSSFPLFDTIGHFVLYGLAAVLLDRAWRGHDWRVDVPGACWPAIPSATLVVGVAALLEEAAQLLSEIRTFSLGDLAADLAGIATFTLVGRLIARSAPADRPAGRWRRPAR